MAKRKSIAFSELTRLKESKSKSKATEKALQKFASRVHEENPDQEFIISTNSKIKMSEVMWDFVAPYIDHIEDLKSGNRLFNLAISAWNLCFFSESERKEMLNEMLLSLCGDDPLLQQDFKDMIQEFINRKLKHFAKYDRLIRDFELREDPRNNTLHLSVASIVTNEEEIKQERERMNRKKN